MLFIGIPLIILSLVSFIQNPFGYVFGYAHSITILSGLSLYFFFYYHSKEDFYIRFAIGIFAAMFTYFAYDVPWNIFYSFVNPQWIQYYYTISLLTIFCLLMYIFFVLNKQFSFVKVNWKWIGMWTVVLVICLGRLYYTNFFSQVYSYINNSGSDPHNFLWLFSKVWSFTLLLPIIRRESKTK